MGISSELEPSVILQIASLLGEDRGLYLGIFIIFILQNYKLDKTFLFFASGDRVRNRVK
jgi:hypothetical protein